MTMSIVQNVPKVKFDQNVEVVGGEDEKEEKKEGEDDTKKWDDIDKDLCQELYPFERSIIKN